MALKETDITITEGRDDGKTYHIKEWPCSRVETWVMRIVFGLGRAGVVLPPEIVQLGAGPAAYVIAGHINKLPSRLGLKLANELMECVTIVEPKLRRALVENDIQDLSTRLQLKAEVLKLTFGFFVPVASPTSTQAASEVPGK